VGTGVGTAVARLEAEGRELVVRRPGAWRSLARYIAMKGSIALDGISLTVAGWRDGIVETAIIPFTYEHTNLFFPKSGRSCEHRVRHPRKICRAPGGIAREITVSRLSVAHLIEEGF